MASHSAPTYQSGARAGAIPGVHDSDEVRGAALEFLALLAREVSSGTVDLPCFPTVVLRIRKALSDPASTPEHTLTVVGAEPRFAAHLLQTANSAAFNTTGRALTDLRSAITRLGHQLVTSAAMAYAVSQIKNEESLRAIAKPMSRLWTDCISVACICHAVARRTRVSPDEAFLTGLLHGMGRLYIMVRAVRHIGSFTQDPAFIHLVAGWHAQIGKAVLQNWGFSDHLADAVGDQMDYERRSKREPDLTDVLIASVVLGSEIKKPEPRQVDLQGIGAFSSIGITSQDCSAILTNAQHQLGAMREALGG